MGNTKNLTKTANISELEYLLYQIKEPIVCVKCSDEFENGLSDAASLQNYCRLDVGFTKRGLQIFCRRHELNVCHLNFNNQKIDADFRCLEKKK